MRNFHLATCIVLVCSLTAVGEDECPDDIVTGKNSHWDPFAPMTMTMKEEWKDITIELHRVGEKQPETVKAKRAVVEITFDTSRRSGARQVIPLVALFSPTSGMSYIGPDQEVFVETETGIIGFHAVSNDLVWNKNLLQDAGNAESSPANLADVLTQFEGNVTAADVLNAVLPVDREEQLAMRSWFGPFVKNPWMFTNGPFNSQPGLPKIVDAEMCGRITVKVKLADQTEQFHATLWINTKSRDVVKVEEEPWEPIVNRFLFEKMPDRLKQKLGGAVSDEAHQPEAEAKSAIEGEKNQKADGVQLAIPVTVVAAVTGDAIGVGDAIPLQVTVHNGLKQDIRHGSYGVSPTEWHGETVNLTLVDVYRDNERAHVLEQPKVDVPLQIAGMSSKRIEPGKSLTIQTDARKWTILGGWIPGRYRVNVRVEKLSVDEGRCQLGVHSEPFEFEIAAAEPADGTTTEATGETAQAYTMSVKEPWKDITIELHRVGEKQPETVKAKRALFEIGTTNRIRRIPVVAFIAPTSGIFWAGLEQDVYIEEPTQIVGFRIIGNRLDWTSNVLDADADDQSQPKTMDELLAVFSRDVTPLDLLNAENPFDLEELAARATPLNPFVKNPWMFTNGPFSSQMGLPKIIDAEMCGRITIKVKLADQTEQFHATLWINTKSRDVVKVEEEPWDNRPKPFVPPKSLPKEDAGVSTEELRQRYVNATTHQEWLAAKKAWIADLTKRYEGIDASVRGPKASEHGARFNRLMVEWNPIHCSAEDLKSIAGKPTEETPEMLYYAFDNGEDGSYWRFTLTGDRITAMEYIPGE